jgi:hypothetical protein
MLMDVDEYIARLYSAFGDAPRPSRREIAPHRCCECDEVASRLAPHRHDEVPPEDMYWLGDCLPLLSPKAFRYYLPSFVAFCLKHRDSSVEALMNYNLAPCGSLDEGERDRCAYFAPSERAVIAEFVVHRTKELEDGDYDHQYLEEAAQYWGAPSDR